MSELQVNTIRPVSGTTLTVTNDTNLTVSGSGKVTTPLVEAADLDINGTSSLELKFNNNTKLAVTNTGATVTGTMAATAFSGDGSGLTGITSAGTGGTSSTGNLQLISNSGGANGARDIIFLDQNSEKARLYGATGDFAVDTDTLYVKASNDRVGIGTTSPTSTLDVDGTCTATAFVGSSATISGNLTVDTSTLFVDAANNKVAIGTAAPSGSHRLHVEGNALIYNGKLEVAGGSDPQTAIFNSAGSTYIDLRRNGTQEVFLQATPTRALVGTSNNQAFAINVIGTDRQLIDTGGSVMFGPGSAIGSGSLSNPRGLTLFSPASTVNYMWYTGGNAYLAYFETHNTTNNNTTGFFHFVAANATVGTIKVNGAGVTYNTTSDYRLKKDVVPLAGALDRVCNMNPCSYTWKDSNRPSEGFLAHELAEVVPYAVSGSKDAVNADGSILPQEVSLSNVVPVLAAAIKELKSLVDAQAARIAALEAAQA